MRHRFASLAACSMIAFFTGLPLCNAVARAQSPERGADALLAIDENRASVVERVVATWGAALARSREAVSIDELRTRLMSLRADRLLGASLAGSEEGLRAAIGFTSTMAKPTIVQTKALGDLGADVVYTPVTPCRLVETRGTFAAVYQGDGTPSHAPVPFAPNEIRNYVVQSGNGVCTSQLPAGLNPSAVQLQVFGMPTTSVSGDIEILPQGAAFGSTATMVYVGTIAFNTVSTAARINTSNDQISVQVRGGGANVAIDVVGYFAPPSGNGGKYFVQGGNAFGTTALLGTADNSSLDLLLAGIPVIRFEPTTDTPNIVAGNAQNVAGPSFYGQTIAGGGSAGQCSASTRGGTVPCRNETASYMATVGGGVANLASGDSSTVAGGSLNAASNSDATVSGGVANVASGLDATVAGGFGNVASGSDAMVAGGSSNVASGFDSFAAGSHVLADQSQCAVFGFFASNGVANCKGLGNIIRLMANHGFSVDWGPANGNGGGTWWVEINDITPCRPINTYTNAYLSCSGVWTSNSDRNKKENFTTIDPLAVLAKVVALPVTRWNYKAEPGVSRIGPMAQDFHAAFDLGPDDLTIAQTDESGVAFAAIQGLHELMRTKDDVIARQAQRLDVQQQRIDDLEARLSRIEAASVAAHPVPAFLPTRR